MHKKIIYFKFHSIDYRINNSISITIESKDF